MQSRPIFVVGLVAAMAACSPLSPVTQQQTTRPQRIVSLDYCADQYLLELADRSQILALSPDATKEFSYLAKQAAGIRTVRSQAEDVIVLRPDLVVRSYGGGPGAERFFERAGLRVAQLSYSDDYVGIIANVRTIAKALGHPERGEALVTDFETRLADVKATNRGLSALYTSPSGITGGAGTMIDRMIDSAGLSNFQKQKGWNPIPLERLARERPNLIIAATFNGRINQFDEWSPSRHPVARAQVGEQTIMSLNGALTSCGGWFVVEAVEAMATKAQIANAPSGAP
jgi:iron complex transport system substrate-binding protein